MEINFAEVVSLYQAKHYALVYWYDLLQDFKRETGKEDINDAKRMTGNRIADKLVSADFDLKLKFEAVNTILRVLGLSYQEHQELEWIAVEFSEYTEKTGNRPDDAMWEEAAYRVFKDREEVEITY